MHGQGGEELSAGREGATPDAINEMFIEYHGAALVWKVGGDSEISVKAVVDARETTGLCPWHPNLGTGRVVVGKLSACMMSRV